MEVLIFTLNPQEQTCTENNMGTKGLITFLYRGKCIVMWNQFDSYPTELGRRLLNQISQSLRNNKWNQFQLRMNYIRMLSMFRQQQTFGNTTTDRNCTVNQMIEKLYVDENDGQVITFDDEIEFPYIKGHYQEWDIETRLKQIPFILNLDRNNVYSHPPVAYSLSQLDIQLGSFKHPRSEEGVSYSQYLQRVDHYYQFFDTDNPKDEQVDEYFRETCAHFNYIIDFHRNVFHVHNSHDSECIQIDINENEFDTSAVFKKYD